jgi:hypothetical protein
MVNLTNDIRIHWLYIATKEKAEEQILTAKELIELVEAYCIKKLKE